MTTLYTCGFLFALNRFDRRHDSVLLVNKLKPDWQKELWNGVGGGVAKNETPRDCVRREFLEETGVDVPIDKWLGFAHETGPGYEVYFYRTFVEGECVVKSVNDRGEPLSYFTVSTVTSGRVRMVGNLNWLIPLARDPRTIVAKIRTPDDIRDEPTW